MARIGQRLIRDDRITTHAALVSRAFGASCIYMSEAGVDIPDTIQSLNQTWGGEFKVILTDTMSKVIRNKKADSYKIVHLSMYGENINNILPDIRCHNRLLVVIGAGKVPRAVYDMADYNVSVGNQPHSEIAALAVFLDRLQGGAFLYRPFPGADRRIIPTVNGKRVVELKRD